MNYPKAFEQIEDVREDVLTTISQLSAPDDGYLRECLEAAARALDNAHHWIQEAQNV